MVAAVSDRASAWRLIERFAQTWGNPLCKGDGYSEAELMTAEQRLGLRLPTALREAYVMFGRRQDLVGPPDGLRPLLSPERLYTQKLHAAGGIELLIFHSENYGCWDCGIRLTDLDLPDPPTVFWNTCGDDDCQTFGAVWLDRLSIACIEIVLTQSLLSDDPALCRRGQLQAHDLDILECTFPRLGLPTYPVSRPPCASGSDWFVGDDVLLRLERYVGTRGDVGSSFDIPSWNRPHTCADLDIRGRTAEAADAAVAQLPRDWFDWPGRSR